MKKCISVILSIILSLGVLFSFSGCKEEVEVGPIPNGDYIGVDEEFFLVDGQDVNLQTWRIEGNNAEFWVSSCLEYKAKIVERDGKIYFEGYKWVDYFDYFTSCQKKQQGNEKIYEVLYEAERKCISVDMY